MVGKSFEELLRWNGKRRTRHATWEAPGFVDRSAVRWVRSHFLTYWQIKIGTAYASEDSGHQTHVCRLAYVERVAFQVHLI